MPLALWWQRWRGLLKHELKALRAAGISYLADKSAFRQGRLALELQYRAGGQTYGLRAAYPDTYPYTRVEVLAPGLELVHHQNPFTKSLCLLGRFTLNWETTETLASLLQGQFPKLLQTMSVAEREDLAGVEEQQAEPFSAYYEYAKDGFILIDSTWEIPPGVEEGTLLLGGAWEDTVRAVVLEVRDANGTVLASADPAVRARYQGQQIVAGRWVRVSTPVPEPQGLPFLAKLQEICPGLVKPLWQEVNDQAVDIICVLFPEEVDWRQTGNGCVFVLKVGVRMTKGFRPGTKHYEFRNAHLVRALRGGQSDLAARTPERQALIERRVAVIGLGCVGAPSAVELARAGIGELRLVDHDIVELGITVRWPLGMSAVGRLKVEVLRDFMASEYPYTSCRTFVHHVGIPGNVRPDREVLAEVMDGVELVYDGTAEFGIHHLLSDLARERGVPYVCVSATPGAWGGRVAVFGPERQAACWMCMQYGLADGRIPTPPADPAGMYQPRACASPTFLGDSVDTGEISLMGVRLAVQTLANGVKALDWNVGTLFLRDDQGQRIAPKWETLRLNRHASCPNH